LLNRKGKVLQPYEKLMWPALVVNNILKEERYMTLKELKMNIRNFQCQANCSFELYVDTKSKCQK
jgi:hypothetical protein